MKTIAIIILVLSYLSNGLVKFFCSNLAMNWSNGSLGNLRNGDVIIVDEEWSAEAADDCILGL